MFISFLYMFGATMCPSSGETTVLCDSWYLLFCMDDWYAGWNETRREEK